MRLFPPFYSIFIQDVTLIILYTFPMELFMYLLTKNNFLPALRGGFFLLLLFSFCFLLIHAAVLLFGKRPPETPPEKKEEKAPPPPPAEPVYYIVERKKHRAKPQYGEPKEIKFK